MSLFSRLLVNDDASVFDKFALFCAAISVICVLSAHGLDLLARNGDLPVLSFNDNGRNAHDRSDGGGKRPGLDYQPTASIAARGQASNLNPCGPR